MVLIIKGPPSQLGKAIWKGSHNPILRELTVTMGPLTTEPSPGMILQVPAWVIVYLQVSHEKKKKQLLLAVKYWLVNRDPLIIMLHEIITKHNWVGFCQNHLYNPI